MAIRKYKIPTISTVTVDIDFQKVYDTVCQTILNEGTDYTQETLEEDPEIVFTEFLDKTEYYLQKIGITEVDFDKMSKISCHCYELLSQYDSIMGQIINDFGKWLKNRDQGPETRVIVNNNITW